MLWLSSAPNLVVDLVEFSVSGCGKVAQYSFRRSLGCNSTHRIAPLILILSFSFYFSISSLISLSICGIVSHSGGAISVSI